MSGVTDFTVGERVAWHSVSLSQEDDMNSAEQSKYRRLVISLCFVVAAGFLITACSESSSPTEPVADVTTSGSGSSDSGSSDSSGGSDDSSGTTDTDVTGGSLQISMTDAPTDEICKLVVYIADLRVKKDGSPAEVLGAVNGVGEYDLMQLQNGQEVVLGNFEVEQGLYQFIEMLLDESQSYVVEKVDPLVDIDFDNCPDVRSPLKIPSAKFKINGGPFEVDEQTEVLIDFDAKKSLKTTGNGKTWQLKPDVSIADVDP
jgi:hypothetical protein